MVAGECNPDEGWSQLIVRQAKRLILKLFVRQFHDKATLVVEESTAQPQPRASPLSVKLVTLVWALVADMVA